MPTLEEQVERLEGENKILINREKKLESDLKKVEKDLETQAREAIYDTEYFKQKAKNATADKMMLEAKAEALEGRTKTAEAKLGELEKDGEANAARVSLQESEIMVLREEKSKLDHRREKVLDLSKSIDMPKESVFIDHRTEKDKKRNFEVTGESIQPESPTGVLYFMNKFTAKQAIYREFGIPLGRLSKEQRKRIDQIIERTLRRDIVLSEAKKIIDELDQNATRNS